MFNKKKCQYKNGPIGHVNKELQRFIRKLCTIPHKVTFKQKSPEALIVLHHIPAWR